MVAEVSVTIEGAPEAVNYLKKKNIKAKDIIQGVMNKVGLLMQGEVKSSIAGRRAEPTSVDTGRFLNSVQFSSNKDSTTIFSQLSYSKFLEFGTTSIKARRHFNNSKSRNINKAAKIINDAIKKL